MKLLVHSLPDHGRFNAVIRSGDGAVKMNACSLRVLNGSSYPLFVWDNNYTGNSSLRRPHKPRANDQTRLCLTSERNIFGPNAVHILDNTNRGRSTTIQSLSHRRVWRFVRGCVLPLWFFCQDFLTSSQVPTGKHWQTTSSLSLCLYLCLSTFALFSHAFSSLLSPISCSLCLPLFSLALCPGALYFLASLHRSCPLPITPHTHLLWILTLHLSWGSWYECTIYTKTPSAEVLNCLMIVLSPKYSILYIFHFHCCQ